MANQNVLDLRDVAAKSRELEGQVVTVEGWVRNHRKQKSIGFIEFSTERCSRRCRSFMTIR